MCQLCDDRERLLTATMQGSSVFNTKQQFKIADRITTSIRNNTTDFLSLSQEQDGKISYAKNQTDTFNNQARIRTTFGRYLRRRLNIQSHQLSDQNLVKWQDNIFARLYDQSIYIEVVTGQAIIEAFLLDFGGHSCMTGPDNQDLIALYAANPNNISLVKFTNGIKARALLWKTDQGQTVLDRIYPNDGNHVEAMRKWATDKGYVYRVRHGHPSSYPVDLSDDNNYTVTVDRTDKLPYMDTFTFADVDDSNNQLILSNHPSARIDGQITLQDTSGLHLEACACYNCGESVSEDDRHYSNLTDENYCGDCFCDTFSYCEDCEQDALREDLVSVGDDTCMCQTCASNLNQCGECGPTRRDTYQVEGSNESYCTDCVSENAAYCDLCSEYHVYHNSVRLPDGDQCCQDCFDDQYVLCDSCDTIIVKVDINRDKDGNHYCDDCCSTCADCHEAVGNDNIKKGEFDADLCETCKQAEETKQAVA